MRGQGQGGGVGRFARAGDGERLLMSVSRPEGSAPCPAQVAVCPGERRLPLAVALGMRGSAARGLFEPEVSRRGGS